MSINSELREQTQILALNISRAFLASKSPKELVRIARGWDQERISTAPESSYRRALAQILIYVYESLNTRILKDNLEGILSPRGSLGLWADNPNSPLVGVLMDITPFQNYDVWAIESLEESIEYQERPRIRRRRIRPFVRDIPTPATPVRRPGPTGIGGDIGRAGRPRPGDSEPGWAHRLIPEGYREIGVPITSLVLRFIAPLTGSLLGAINLFVSLTNALDSADRTQEREGKSLGVRLGLAALTYLTSAQLRTGRVSYRHLMGIVRAQPSLLRLRERSVRFSGSSGPDLVNRSIDSGIQKVAREISAIISQVESQIEDSIDYEFNSSRRIEARRQMIRTIQDEAKASMRNE